jgi:asparagine synthase (glutamine-hydrolysing)
MCGIAGIIDYQSSSDHGPVVQKMATTMSHRGPDAAGFHQAGKAFLGHTRLSIIDLASCSNQPMADATGRYHIVFNGEIYNYRQLRSRLPDYSFSTNGDTEVILAAYSSWGPECVKEMAGMFAFAIWDAYKETLFLSRDRLGVKPLYYFESSGRFLFASELKALLASGIVSPSVDKVAVSEFLQFQSITFPSTILQDVQMVEAGTWLTITRSEKVIGRYWNMVQATPGFDFSDSGAIREHTRQLLYQSVERRMVSDVPVAAFLSGGIDSTAVVGIMSSISSEPVNTFNVSFDESRFDESAYAKAVAERFRTRHQEVRVKSASFLDELLPALDAMDTPSGDGVNSYVVSKAIRQTGIKVALSGTGGDELFAGYPIFAHYFRLMKAAKWWSGTALLRQMLGRLIPQQGRLDRYRELLVAGQAGIAAFYPALRRVIPAYRIKVLTDLPLDVGYPMHGSLAEDPALQRLPLLSQVSVAEYMGYTQNTLLRDMDQMSMANSLEVREPFFDHNLVEFIMHVPDHQKISSLPKSLLVESLEPLVPADVARRKKQGFEFPWKIWMKEDLKTFCQDRIESIGERDFINKKQLKQHWERFLRHDPSISWMELWLFVVLEHWLRKNNVR